MSLNTSVQVAKMYNVPVIKTYIIITILYIMQVSVAKCDRLPDLKTTI